MSYQLCTNDSTTYSRINSARKAAMDHLLRMRGDKGAIIILNHNGETVETVEKVHLAWNESNTLLTYQHRYGIWKLLHKDGSVSGGYFETYQRDAGGKRFEMVKSGWIPTPERYHYGVRDAFGRYVWLMPYGE